MMSAMMHVESNWGWRGSGPLLLSKKSLTVIKHPYHSPKTNHIHFHLVHVCECPVVCRESLATNLSRWSAKRGAWWGGHILPRSFSSRHLNLPIAISCCKILQYITFKCESARCVHVDVHRRCYRTNMSDVGECSWSVNFAKWSTLWNNRSRGRVDMHKTLHQVLK